MKVLHGIICLWQHRGYVKEGSPWEFVESFGVDDDGYACTHSVHATSDRNPCGGFVLKKVEGGDGDDCDYESVPGRLITIWTPESGVELYDFNPPAGDTWISPEFVSHMPWKKDWLNVIEGGYAVSQASSQRAIEMIVANVSGVKNGDV